MERTSELTNTAQLKKGHLLAVFAGCLVFNMMLLMGAFSVNIKVDDIVPFFGAARLAGLDWSGVTGTYHGQAYYVIFTPLFMVTDNVLIRHTVVQIVNMCVLSTAGVIIYYIAVKYFMLENNFFTALVSMVIIARNVFGGGINAVAITARNEVPIFLVVWIICLISAMLCNTEQKKCRIALTLLLVLTLCYGMLLHVRMLTPLLAISFTILLYFLIFRKWIAEPLVYFPSVIIGYLLVAWIRSVELAELWGTRAAADISGGNLRTVMDASRIPSIRVIADIIINNIYAITVRTYGLAAITAVFSVYLIYRLILSLKKRRLSFFCDDIGLPKDQFFVIMVFGICLVATILGLCTRYGRGIDRALSAGTGEWVNAFVGLQYVRYYSPYFGPVLLSLYAYLGKNRKTGSMLCLAAIGLFVALYMYVRYIIFPYAGNRSYISLFFIPADNVGFESTVAVITIMIALYALCLYINSGKHFFVLLFSAVLIARLNGMSIPFFNAQPPTEARDLYQVLDGIKNKTPLPYEIYSMYTGRRVQFLFSHHHVIEHLPDFKEDVSSDSIFICTTEKIDDYAILYDYGYVLYTAGNQAVWFRGEALQEALWNYAQSNGTTENIIEG